jgi:hypothetical protein
MRAVFVEFWAFARHRPRYLDDDAYRLLQEWLMHAPELGALMQGTGWPGCVREIFHEAPQEKPLQ